MYITGYYRDGRYEKTFYSLPDQMYNLQKNRAVAGSYWEREYEKAHVNIDDYFQQ